LLTHWSRRQSFAHEHLLCAGGGREPNQTDAGSVVAAVAIKPVLHSYAHEHLLCVICGCSPVACASNGSSPSQADAPSNTAVRSQLDSSQIEPELRAVPPVAALQLHEPRAPVTDHPPSLHGHACAGDGSISSQTDAPSSTTVAHCTARTSTNHICPFTVTYIHPPWVDLGVM